MVIGVGDPIDLRSQSFNLSEKYFQNLSALVPRASGSLFEVNAVEQQLQGLWRQTDLGGRFTCAPRKVEATFLQSFGQDDHASAVKIKNLDSVAAVVAKNKQCPAPRIFPQLRLRRVPQTLEASSQIARRSGDEHFEMGVKT
jgi:hypothetical protein